VSWTHKNHRRDDFPFACPHRPPEIQLPLNPISIRCLKQDEYLAVLLLNLQRVIRVHGRQQSLQVRAVAVLVVQGDRLLDDVAELVEDGSLVFTAAAAGELPT